MEGSWGNLRSPFLIFSYNRPKILSSKGTRPVNMTYNITPRLQTSTSGPNNELKWFNSKKKRKKERKKE